jgi:hypothetical protein
MVERIMLFKLHDPEQRGELAKLARDTLIDLEGIEEISVGLPADPASAKSWDMSLVLAFASEAAQNVVLGGAAFRELIEQRLGERVQVLKGWSFERLG